MNTEKNHTLLKQTLMELPNYVPNAQSWELIQRKLELDALPSYDPAPELWPKIQHGVDKASALRVAIGELPSHDPDERLWSTIHDELIAKTTPRSLSTWYYAAASVFLLITMAWLYNNQLHHQASHQLAFTQEQYIPLVPMDQSLEKEALAFVNERCKFLSLICSHGDVGRLKTELEDLNIALETLQEAFGSYENDPEMLAQITQIELEKTAVIKQMINKVSI